MFVSGEQRADDELSESELNDWVSGKLPSPGAASGAWTDEAATAGGAAGGAWTDDDQFAALYQEWETDAQPPSHQPADTKQERIDQVNEFAALYRDWAQDSIHVDEALASHLSQLCSEPGTPRWPASPPAAASSKSPSRCTVGRGLCTV